MSGSGRGGEVARRLPDAEAELATRARIRNRADERLWLLTRFRVWARRAPPRVAAAEAFEVVDLGAQRSLLTLHLGLAAFRTRDEQVLGCCARVLCQKPYSSTGNLRRWKNVDLSCDDRQTVGERSRQRESTQGRACRLSGWFRRRRGEVKPRQGGGGRRVSTSCTLPTRGRQQWEESRSRRPPGRSRTSRVAWPKRLPEATSRRCQPPTRRMRKSPT